MLLGNYFNKLIYFLRSENIFYFGKEPFVIGGNENIRADRMLRKRRKRKGQTVHNALPLLCAGVEPDSRRLAVCFFNSYLR